MIESDAIGTSVITATFTTTVDGTERSFTVTNPTDRDLRVTSLIDRFFDRDDDTTQLGDDIDLLAAFIEENEDEVLASNTSVTFTYVHEMSTQDRARGFADNTVVVEAIDDELPNPKEPVTDEDASADVTYVYTVFTTGELLLTDVTLTDDVLGDLTDELRTALGGSTMAVGEQVDITVVQTVGVADIGTLVNVATVTGTAPNGTEVSAGDEATVDIVQVLGEVIEPDPAP